MATVQCEQELSAAVSIITLSLRAVLVYAGRGQMPLMSVGLPGRTPGTDLNVDCKTNEQQGHHCLFGYAPYILYLYTDYIFMGAMFTAPKNDDG